MNRHEPNIERLLARLRKRGQLSREDAEDLLQDARLRMVEFQQTGDKVRNEPAFLTHIVGNLAINQRRRRALIDFDVEPVEKLADRLGLADPSTDPLRRVAELQELEMIWRLLGEYSPLTRDIYFARRLGYSFPEIAAAFKIDEDTVEHHIARAVYQLMTIKEKL